MRKRIDYRHPKRRAPQTSQRTAGGWLCGSCAQVHEGLAFSFGAEAPSAWLQVPEHVRLEGELTPDMCVFINADGMHQFIRVSLQLPIMDAAGEVFEWTVWCSLSEASMEYVADRWDDPNRAFADPVFGWLGNSLPYAESTLHLPGMVHQRELGLIPFLKLDPRTDHPLVAHQRKGISMHEVAQINALFAD